MHKWFLCGLMVLMVVARGTPVFAEDMDQDTDEHMITETPLVLEEDVTSSPDDESSAESADVVMEDPTPSAPTFVVIMPERIDHDWFWLLYSDRSQHIVQSEIEKALIRAGLNVIDLNTATLPTGGSDMKELMSMAYGLKAGRALNADYLITGQATAVKASEGRAYGVNVVRTQAEVSARIVRIRDGKILAVEDASMLEGGQSVQAAGQTALKKAGGQIAGKLARAARTLAESDSADR